MSRGSWITLAPGWRFEHRLGQQADNIIALDKLTRLVKNEAAVKITVPRNTQVGAALQDSVPRGGPVLLEQRIRDTVWEAPVRLVVNAYELQRQKIDRARR